MPLQNKLKYTFLFCLIFPLAALAQKNADAAAGTDTALYKSTGIASYYHNKFHGRRTTNGERYNKKLLTAAHRTLPFGTRVKVTNLQNGRWVIVRVNDRGPRSRKRLIDLSYRAARHLGMTKGSGITKVRVEEMPPLPDPVIPQQ